MGEQDNGTVKDQVKSELKKLKSKFTWERLKRTWLSYFYPMAGLLFILGVGLIYMALPPWHFREDGSFVEKLGAMLTFLVLGAGHVRVAVWAFKRGPVDLSPGGQIFSSVLCLFAAGLMFFVAPSEPDGGYVGRMILCGLMVAWGGVIFYRLRSRLKKNLFGDTPQAGKES